MKVSKDIQGVFQYCPRGDMNGLFVTKENLKKFAKLLGNEYIDKTIPLSQDNQPLQRDCPDCHAEKHEVANEIYWETDTGSHGWCCGTCGTVMQWG